VKIIHPSVCKDFLAWLELPFDTKWPKSKNAWAEQHGVNVSTLNKWEKEGSSLKEVKEEYDSEKSLLEKLREVDGDLVLSCKKGNAQALKIFFQRVGLLVEKPQEINIFNANDYITGSGDILGKLRADFRKYGGACPVCGKSESVCYEPCVDSEPEHSEDREVATLALPAGPEQHNTEV